MSPDIEVLYRDNIGVLYGNYREYIGIIVYTLGFDIGIMDKKMETSILYELYRCI